MKLVQDGEVVGSVTFEPYEFRYEGDEPVVQNMLEGAARMRELQGGEPPEGAESDMPGEQHVEVFGGQKQDVLEAKLERVGVELREPRRANVLQAIQNAVGWNASQYEAGDRVDTPDGLGVVDDAIVEGSIPGTDLEPSSDSPVYAVALVEETTTEFYRASDLQSASKEDFGVPDDVKDSGLDETDQDQSENAETGLSANDWSMPPTWRDSSKPARLILLDAWADMGGQFDCGGACCMGDLHSHRLCAAMKDEVLGTEKWRGGWAD